jgi:hypothetical protein
VWGSLTGLTALGIPLPKSQLEIYDGASTSAAIKNAHLPLLNWQPLTQYQELGRLYAVGRNEGCVGPIGEGFGCAAWGGHSMPVTAA